MKLLDILEQRYIDKEASAAQVVKTPHDTLMRAVKSLVKFVKGLPKGERYGYELDKSKLKTALNATESWVMNNPKKSLATAGGLGLTTGATAAIATKQDKKER